MKNYYRVLNPTLCIIFVFMIVVLSNSYFEIKTAYDEVVITNNQLYEQLQQLEEEKASLQKELAKQIEELNKVDLPVYGYTKEEIDLLARCVEAEAGCSNYKSQKYITQVILNRVHSGKFPNSIEKVIYQKRYGIAQFSVAYNGMMNREVQPDTLANVYSVIVHGTDLPDYVYYFYSEKVTNNWINTLPIYDTVQGTVFAYES